MKKFFQLLRCAFILCCRQQSNGTLELESAQVFDAGNDTYAKLVPFAQRVSRVRDAMLKLEVRNEEIALLASLCLMCSSKYFFHFAFSAWNFGKFFAFSFFHLKFCELFHSLGTLELISDFFSARRGLQNATQIEKLQEPLLEALQVQVKMRENPDRCLMPKLLMMLSDIRSLTLGKILFLKLVKYIYL